MVAPSPWVSVRSEAGKGTGAALDRQWVVAACSCSCRHPVMRRSPRTWTRGIGPCVDWIGRGRAKSLRVDATWSRDSPHQRARKPRDRPERGGDVRTVVHMGLVQSLRGASLAVSYDRLAACPSCDGVGASLGQGLELCGICGGSGRALVYPSSPFYSATAPSVSQEPALSSAPCQAPREGRWQSCPGCSGAGSFIVEDCKGCQGGGRVVEMRTMQVMVPPGVAPGSWVRVRGMGHEGVAGGTAGDLYVKCVVGTLPGLTRKGCDLESPLEVSVWDALLGCEAHVETMSGWRVLSVPPGTQHGDRLAVKGAGVEERSEQSVTVGDHVFVVCIRIPQQLDEDAVIAVDRLRRA